MNPQTTSKPMHEFWRAFVYGGTNAPTCDGCGTTYVARGGYYEEGELERFELDALENPERTVIEDCDTITLCNLNGQNIVDGCEKCAARVARFETFVWQHREQIISYFKARSDRELEEAKRMTQGLQTLLSNIP